MVPKTRRKKKKGRKGGLVRSVSFPYHNPNHKGRARPRLSCGGEMLIWDMIYHSRIPFFHSIFFFSHSFTKKWQVEKKDSSPYTGGGSGENSKRGRYSRVSNGTYCTVLARPSTKPKRIHRTHHPSLLALFSPPTKNSPSPRPALARRTVYIVHEQRESQAGQFLTVSWGVPTTFEASPSHNWTRSPARSGHAGFPRETKVFPYSVDLRPPPTPAPPRFRETHL